MRHELFDLVLKQDLRFFDRPENSVGALMSRLDSYPQAILELMGINVGLVVLAGINVLISAILALAISWRVSVIGVFVALPPLLVSGLTRVSLEGRVDANMDKRYALSSSVASEAVLAIRTVSSLAIERSVLAAYAGELDAAIRRGLPGIFHMMIWFAITQSTEYFVLGLGFWFVHPSRPRCTTRLDTDNCDPGGDRSSSLRNGCPSISSSPRSWQFTSQAKAQLRCSHTRAVGALVQRCNHGSV